MNQIPITDLRQRLGGAPICAVRLRGLPAFAAHIHRLDGDVIRLRPLGRHDGRPIRVRLGSVLAVEPMNVQCWEDYRSIADAALVSRPWRADVVRRFLDAHDSPGAWS